ncbi:hypothetical protein BBK36DRAFT_1171978 [Trichoderma citrinoviride]|uniref:Azaphilone pigments biosynthesis cluster protein L N-terminal domain-containing protein n=1 Tax=Trichoderma citrinoviride TaxID=58853 RepID=A0A2T4B1R7_9HYPO|nr:hypothetical protein BBK36DRAFT_1171978 [Trichoderma citrinoviride]PTB63178.1 hypothetical protein BBK36DRAFT_1171978 [Trichoderma citrinoviride]
MTDFAGVASSGVQACSAIATYISSLKHRDEDLASINRQAQALESVFRVLSQSLAQDSLDPSTSSAAAHVSSSMQTCEAELSSLKQLIARFSDNLPPNARPQDKMLQQATKLKYPLRKPDIDRFQESLGVIKENLNLALQNLGLRYSQLAISKLSELQEASGQASLSLDALVSNVSALRDLVSPIQKQMSTMQDLVESIPPLISMKADLQLAQVQELYRQSTQSNDALSGSVSGLHAKLDGLVDRFQHGLTAVSAVTDEPDPLISVYRLVSKQSNLALLCDSLNNLNATPTINPLQKAPTVKASSCPCRQRSIYRSKRVSWWSWTFWDAEVLMFEHYKGCKYFRKSGHGRSRLRRLKLAGFLKTAIIITFYTTTGAAQWERLALAAIRKLETLFRLGKADAKDVDSDNRSLLHAAAEVSRGHDTWLHNTEDAFSSPIAQVAGFLVKMQVPASLRDLRGNQAFGIAMHSIHFSVPLAAAFYPEDAAIDAIKGQVWIVFGEKPQWLNHCLEFFTTIPRVAELYHDPLSAAVLLNDQDQTHRLVRKHPEYLDEIGYFSGWTPLHMALNNPDFGDQTLASASKHCRVYLAKSLLQRRQRLKSIALQYLSPREINGFNLRRPAVLDIYAMQVDEILRHRGYIEFGPLSTYFERESTFNDNGSIYHELSTVEDAEIYFGLGFHDMSARLDKPMESRPTSYEWYLDMSLPFVKWLLDHDAPLYEWAVLWGISGNGRIADAFILAILCGCGAGNRCAEESDEEVARVLEERMLSDRSVDGCHCLCSPGGCTPFVERMKEMGLRNDELEIAARFTAYLEEYGNALQREHYQAAIRFTTFQALGIAHTCIRISQPRYVHELVAEEIEDIQHEYAELSELLELLVEEFEAHAFEAFDAATDGLDSMIAFWDGYWVDRMGDASKPAAEELGVVWVPEPDITPFEWRGWDFYFRCIEDIE